MCGASAPNFQPTFARLKPEGVQPYSPAEIEMWSLEFECLAGVVRLGYDDFVAASFHANQPFRFHSNSQVWRGYDDFVAELSARFPHEKEGIRKFYDECWKV